MFLCVSLFVAFIASHPMQWEEEETLVTEMCAVFLFYLFFSLKMMRSVWYVETFPLFRI